MKILYTLLMLSVLAGSAQAYPCPPYGGPNHLAEQSFKRGAPFSWQGANWSVEQGNLNVDNITDREGPQSSWCTVRLQSFQCCNYSSDNGRGSGFFYAP